MHHYYRHDIAGRKVRGTAMLGDRQPGPRKCQIMGEKQSPLSERGLWTVAIFRVAADGDGAALFANWRSVGPGPVGPFLRGLAADGTMPCLCIALIEWDVAAGCLGIVLDSGLASGVATPIGLGPAISHNLL